MKYGDNPKAVVVLSGGVDSTTLLYDLMQQGYDVYPITFFYGQRHSKEVDCAKMIVSAAGVRQNWIAYPLVSLGKIGGSSLTDPQLQIPKGHYKDASMKQTVVPNRNMILLSFALAHAIAINVPEIFYGAHAGDHDIYPDCRPEFVERMQEAAKVCSYAPIELEAPYLHLSKKDIVTKGIQLNVPYEHTWTCYEGKPLACGKCGSCVEKVEAFEENGRKDPIDYEGS